MRSSPELSPVPRYIDDDEGHGEVGKREVKNQIEIASGDIERLNRGVQQHEIKLTEAEPRVLALEKRIHDLEKKLQEASNIPKLGGKTETELRSEIEFVNSEVRSGTMAVDEADKKVAELELHIRALEAQRKLPDLYDEARAFEQFISGGGSGEGEGILLNRLEAIDQQIDDFERWTAEFQQLYPEASPDQPRATETDGVEVGSGKVSPETEPVGRQARGPQSSIQTPEAAAQDANAEQLAAEKAEYLGRKRAFKEAQRAYLDSLAAEYSEQNLVSKLGTTFGFGQKGLSSEGQAAYDTFMAANKEFYEYCTENGVYDRIKEQYARRRPESDSLGYAVADRHVFNPAKRRLEAQSGFLPERLRTIKEAIVEKVGEHPKAAAAVGVTLVVGGVVLHAPATIAGLSTAITGNKFYVGRKELQLDDKWEGTVQKFEQASTVDLEELEAEYFTSARAVDVAKVRTRAVAMGAAAGAGATIDSPDISGWIGERLFGTDAMPLTPGDGPVTLEDGRVVNPEEFYTDLSEAEQASVGTRVGGQTVAEEIGFDINELDLGETASQDTETGQREEASAEQSSGRRQMTPEEAQARAEGRAATREALTQEIKPSAEGRAFVKDFEAQLAKNEAQLASGEKGMRSLSMQWEDLSETERQLFERSLSDKGMAALHKVVDEPGAGSALYEDTVQMPDGSVKTVKGVIVEGPTGDVAFREISELHQSAAPAESGSAVSSPAQGEQVTPSDAGRELTGLERQRITAMYGEDAVKDIEKQLRETGRADYSYRKEYETDGTVSHGAASPVEKSAPSGNFRPDVEGMMAKGDGVHTEVSPDGKNKFTWESDTKGFSQKVGGTYEYRSDGGFADAAKQTAEAVAARPEAPATMDSFLDRFGEKHAFGPADKIEVHLDRFLDEMPTELKQKHFPDLFETNDAGQLIEKNHDTYWAHKVPEASVLWHNFAEDTLTPAQWQYVGIPSGNTDDLTGAVLDHNRFVEVLNNKNVVVPAFDPAVHVAGKEAVRQAAEEAARDSAEAARASAEALANKNHALPATTEQIVAERNSNIMAALIQERSTGYQPLIAPSFENLVTTPPADQHLMHHVYQEMLKAFQSGQINIPAERLQYVQNDPTALYGFIEAHAQELTDKPLSAFFRGAEGLDLSAGEWQALGFSSGRPEVVAGDQIQMGKLIKLILEQAAEDINSKLRV